MTRSHARAPVGQRAKVVEPFKVGVKLSVIGALSLNGIGATLTIEGSIDGDVFKEYVKHFLCRELKAGDIVIMDNIKFHHNHEIIDMIEATGARVEHLPAYSPDLNPIEECISKLKALMRRNKPETKRKLQNALLMAIKNVTKSDISGWFKHCGYTYSLN